MKRLRVRTLLLLALVAASALSWIAYVVARIAESRSFRLDLGEGEPSAMGIGIAALSGVALAVGAIGYGLRRWMAKPLEAMGRGARGIAEGDLDVVLPQSRIREIADVRDGFETMVAGLRRSLAEREALEEERRFFIGAIAHDLRTPLFSLRGYLQGLDQGIASTPEQRQRYLSVCMDKAAELDRLVSDLFAFVKSDYPVAAQAGEALDLASEAARSAEGMRAPAEAKGVSVTVETERGSASDSCLVRGDAHQLARAIGNLLDNAVRHTPAGGSIVVRCGREADRVAVVVRDSGSGFAPEDLRRAFEPLYRGEASRSRETGGAGLGLAIARRIFRAHGGDLAAANGPDGGAELRGWLPVCDVPADERGG